MEVDWNGAEVDEEGTVAEKEVGIVHDADMNDTDIGDDVAEKEVGIVHDTDIGDDVVL